MTHASDDPRWPRAAAWLSAQPSSAEVSLAVLGAPLRLGSITPGRCDLAPEAIRRALDRFSSYDVAHDCDLRRLPVRDLGDLDLAETHPRDALDPLASAVSSALESAAALVLLGGDNSVTRPACRGIAPSFERCALLTLDAHLDLRDLDAGLTNGNPVRALLADGLPGPNIAQLGIQSFVNSRDYARVARAAGITVVPVEQLHAQGVAVAVEATLAALSERADVIYVDFDLDVLDRAFAPATPGSRPGGITPLDLRLAARVCGMHPKVRVLDLVELDPTQDIADATVLAAAACLLSFASGVCAR